MAGGVEVNLSEPEFPLKELRHTNISQTVCVCGKKVQTAGGVSWSAMRGSEGNSEVKPTAV